MPLSESKNREENPKPLRVYTPEYEGKILEESEKESEKDLYTKRITRIEGGNLRGGAPGKTAKGRTQESTEKAVKAIHEKFHPKTVISFENPNDDDADTEVLNMEKKTWAELEVKFIELPVEETELKKLFGDELKSKTLEAFNALDKGDTFVHCTHGLQRAPAFIEIWRATKGINRRDAIEKNPAYQSSEGHRKCGNDTREIIKEILKGENTAIQERKTLTKTVGETLEQTEQPTEQIQEFQQPPSKELQQKLSKEIEEITEEQRKQDEQKLMQAEIKDIRFDEELLDNINRLAQYTEKQEDGGLRINYAKFNSSGRDHEMNIGLGDIMPPKYKRIAVVTSGGSVRIGTRGLVNTSKESNRVGYMDETTGGYLATFTGDTIYVLDPPITDEKELAELLAKEKEARTNGSQNFTEYSAGGGYESGYNSYKSPAESGEQLKSDYDEYLAKREELKKKLDPAPISEIPETPQNQEIPKKKKGVKRLAIFSDTDDKSHETIRQQNLEAFQKKLPEWEADMALGVGDYISETAAHSNEKYGQVAQAVREEFKKFTTPYALALGNHDRNHSGGKTDTMQDLFKNGLAEYEEVDGAYSFTLGKSTFVVFNEGTSTITDTQTEFFERKSGEAKGAVYMVNHIPPYQFAYGAGLSKEGTQKTKNFEKIREIARKNLESQGKPFYIISGDNHLPTVLGNFLSPGGMGAKYFGLNKGRLQTLYSAAVVDIDEETGKILAVYFRGADSGFNDPLPDLQSAMAQGKPLPEQEMAANTLTAGSQPIETLGEPVTQETINSAAKECSNHGMTIEQAVKKPNLMKVISHIAKASKIPAYAIIAILRQECGFKFYPPIIGDNGAAVGMAQHHIAGWEELKKTRLFQETVKPYTNKNPTTLDRGENIVADILSIAIRLKDGANALGFNIDDTTDLTKDAPIQKGPTELAMTRLEWLRAYYKRPGDIGPFINPDKYRRTGKASRVERARRSIPGDRKSYKKFNDNSALAKNALEATYGPQSKYAETQQPPQATEHTTHLTTREQQIAQEIESMPKPNFDYDAVYVLGYGNPRESQEKVFKTNHERMVAGAALALKNNAAFLTSGGATPHYQRIGTTEGREGFDYAANNPYFKERFITQNIITGVEDKSGSTVSNIKNALSFFKKQGYKRILIVTDSEGHAKRAIHEKEGRGLKDLAPELEVSFYTPDSPNIDNNLA